MAQPDTADDPDETARRITLTENPDGWWTARDTKAEVTAEGETAQEALEAIQDVRAAAHGEAGHEPTDEEIRELGVDPEIARSQDGDLPDVLP
ncbi:MAG: type II toxin-antitoxin system HicB family antitoxin [Halodesulfurarchaeum sp.]